MDHMPKMIRPRLAPDVVRLVVRNAAISGRTPPSEVNFVIRRYYDDQLEQLKRDQRSFGAVNGKRK